MGSQPKVQKIIFASVDFPTLLSSSAVISVR
ncbi:hypothetical protein YPPY14_1301, partial [Yersinia pestis PY-14]